jgi:uncharacterized protein involved in exopolysaccharide biosynthesis
MTTNISQNDASNVMPNQSYPAPEYYDEDEIDLVALWHVLKRRKWVILSTLTVVLGLGVTYVLLAKPVYVAEVSLIDVAKKQESKMASLAGQFGGLASLAGINLGGGGGGEGQNVAAILQSRSFSERFIREEDLMITLNEKRWDAENKQWIADKRGDIPTLAETANAFRKLIALTTEKGTGVKTLSVEWDNPVLAASWANGLVVYLNRYLKQYAIEESQKNIQYLEKELARTGVVDSQQMLYRLIENETKTAMMANVRDDFAFRVLDSALQPKYPEKPKKKLIVAVALILGLILGILLAFLVDLIVGSKKQHVQNS